MRSRFEVFTHPRRQLIGDWFAAALSRPVRACCWFASLGDRHQLFDRTNGETLGDNTGSQVISRAEVRQAQ